MLFGLCNVGIVPTFTLYGVIYYKSKCFLIHLKISLISVQHVLTYCNTR